jgi:hypothetical protein
MSWRTARPSPEITVDDCRNQITKRDGTKHSAPLDAVAPVVLSGLTAQKKTADCGPFVRPSTNSLNIRDGVEDLGE